MLWWATLLAYIGGEIAGSVLLYNASNRETAQYYKIMGKIAAALTIAYLLGWNSDTIGYLLASAVGFISPISLKR